MTTSPDVPVLLFAPLFLIVLTLAVAALAFWIWMIVDCATKEFAGNDKIIWLLVIILLHFLGALIYFFARRLNRPKSVAAAPVATPPRL
jgi:ABC-type multidrug transport system fused ATPase/permease subunit